MRCRRAAARARRRAGSSSRAGRRSRGRRDRAACPRVVGESWESSEPAEMAMAMAAFSSTMSVAAASARAPGSGRPGPLRRGAVVSVKAACASAPSPTATTCSASSKPTPFALTTYSPGGAKRLASPLASVRREPISAPERVRTSTSTDGRSAPSPAETTLRDAGARVQPLCSRRAVRHLERREQVRGGGGIGRGGHDAQIGTPSLRCDVAEQVAAVGSVVEADLRIGGQSETYGGVPSAAR